MHIESENYDFLMYTLNVGKPVPYIPSTTVPGDSYDFSVSLGLEVYCQKLMQE